MKDDILFNSTNYDEIVKRVNSIIKKKRLSGTYQKLLDETLDSIIKMKLSDKDYKLLFIYEILNKFNFLYKIYHKLSQIKITSFIIKQIKLILKGIIRKIFY